MAVAKQQRREPAGFTTRTSGLASEYAREQGWEINEEQRSRTAIEKQKYDGGIDYDYGAQNIGHEPNNSESKPKQFERRARKFANGPESFPTASPWSSRSR